MRSLCAFEPVYARYWVVSGAMSSECRCHIPDAYCFYCEEYSPLERKYEEQRQAIERLIVELDGQASAALHNLPQISDSQISVGFWNGVYDTCTEIQERLKEVLSNADNPNQQHPPDAERT